jgi:DNA repair protein RadD
MDLLAGPSVERFNAESNARQAPALRDYQVDVDANVRAAFSNGARRVLAVAPTGSGKTVLFAHVVDGAARKGRRVLILAHRAEILEQIGGALARHGLDHGLIAPGADKSGQAVQVASIATIARRLEHWRDAFDLVVVDEAHHAISDSWRRVLDAMPSAKIIGVTATPERLDGRGLGDIFDEMVLGPTVARLIAEGHLAPFTIFAPDAAPDLSGVRIRAGDYAVEDLRDAMGGVVVSSAVEEYGRLCPGVPAVVFCVDIDHSKAVAAAFRASGVRAAHVDGETPAQERRAAVEALGRGEIDVLCNVALFGEGVDVPGIGAAILLRPTQSVALYLQQVGRALRPAPNKARAIVLDFAGNSIAHGLPDAPRAWSLEARRRRDRAKDMGSPVRRCVECGAVNPRAVLECVECGADLRTPKERAEIQMRLRAEQDAELAEQIRRMSYRQRVECAGVNQLRLNFVAACCGYKPGWIYHRLQEVGGANG